jgi:hypothetical protein
VSNFKYCNSCGYKLPSHCEVCVNCKNTLIEKPSPVITTPINKNNIRRSKISLICFFTIIVFAFGIALIMPKKKKSAAETAQELKESNRWAAFYDSRRIVRSLLKAPSTAQFCQFKQATVTNKKNIYSVDLYVDSQNGFGAMLRSHFHIKMNMISKGKFLLVDVKQTR